MKKTILICSAIIVLAMSNVVYAADHAHNHGDAGHGSSHAGHEQMQMDKSDKSEKPQMFLVKKEVDGYSVSFHVMLAGGMYHGGSHNLMIKIERDGLDADIKFINSKVFYPNGASESKMLIKMGDWYMNGYDFHGDKKHGLMVLFKTADGKKHKVSAYYPESK